MAGQQTFARSNIVMGTNGTGKSTWLDKKIIEKTHFKNVLVYLETIDSGGTPYAKLPLINASQYRGGKACIDANSIGIRDFLQWASKNYRNGIIVIDEAGKHTWEIYSGTPKALVPELVDILSQRRKYNVETYFLYHNANQIPTHLFNWCNNLILFHQTGVFAHKSNIPAMDEIKAASLRVKTAYMKGNLYYSERVQLS